MGGKPQIKVTHQKMNGVEPAGPELDMTAKTVVPGTMGQYRDHKGRELVFKYTQHLNDGSGKSKKTWVYLRYDKYESYVKEVKCETRVHGVLVQGSTEHITRDETFDAQIFYQPNKPKPFTWSQRLEPKTSSRREGKSKITITCTPYLGENGEARRTYHMNHSLNGDVSHKFLQAKRRKKNLPNGVTMITMPQPEEMFVDRSGYKSIKSMSYEIYITNNQVREVIVKTNYRHLEKDKFGIDMTFHSEEQIQPVPLDQAFYGIDTTRTIKNMDHPSNRH